MLPLPYERNDALNEAVDECLNAASQLRGLRLMLYAIRSCADPGSDLEKDIAAAHRVACDLHHSLERVLTRLLPEPDEPPLKSVQGNEASSEETIH